MCAANVEMGPRSTTTNLDALSASTRLAETASMSSKSWLCPLSLRAKTGFDLFHDINGKDKLLFFFRGLSSAWN
jgi:hypothetical protein